MVRRIVFVILTLSCLPLPAETDVLEHYVRQGLESNLALQQEELVLDRTLQALREARGLFFPSVDIASRYSHTHGGRIIEVPVGDLVNPIYHTLNALLQQEVFPEDLPNEQIRFLRETDHETKVRLVQPLFQPRIYYNYKTQQYLTDAQQAERNAFVRQLIAEIKVAYFNYLRAARVVESLQRTEQLLQENLRVSESLFQNQKATEEVVFRAKAELSELEQQQAIVEKNRVLAASFLNFLINRPLDAPIIEIEDSLLQFPQPVSLAEAQDNALRHRDEFARLQKAIQAVDNQVKFSKSAFLPALSLVFDYGFQGEKYRFNGEDNFWIGSLVLQWNLFNGFQDEARVQQTKLEKKRFEVQLEELEQQILLQVREADQNLTVARKTLVATDDRLSSARKSFNIVRKKYREGIASQIEFIDARTTLTSSEVNRIIARYNYQIRLAEFERVTAMHPIPGRS